MRKSLLLFLAITLMSAAHGQVTATRIGNAPLLTVDSDPSLAGNVNGPALIRVPSWLPHPKAKYYMYFANHKGRFIRLAYANKITGPWTIYTPGVLNDSETAFTRPQPDPPGALYTHIASPDVYIDNAAHRIILWVHGMWTDNKPWPANLQEGPSYSWLGKYGYNQRTQAFESTDGIHFTAPPAITPLPYLRVLNIDGVFYGVGRSGKIARSTDPFGEFQVGRDLFRGSKYAGRSRHVALLLRGKTLFVFFSATGDAPEHILVATVDISDPDWTTWIAKDPQDVLLPERAYECANLPIAQSNVGDADNPVHELRDPGIFEEAGKVYLLYSTCGEQGIALAELHFGK
jgi:hypothetical protein